MSEKLEPVSEAIRGALDAERARPMPSPEHVARLASRLEATFGAATAATAATATTAAAGGSSVAAAGLTAGKVLLFAAGVAVGGVGGAALHAQLAAPKVIEVPKIVEVKVPVPAPAPATPEAAPPPAPAPARRPHATEPAAPRSSLDTERLLVEQAASALARGQAAQALEACERHAALFPNGKLVEERESVAIRALVAAGRRDEAKQRALAFRARFPESMLQGVIDAALAEPR